MRINIKATGIELTSAISDYAEKKVISLEKYLESNTDVVAHVEVGKTTQHHKSGDVFRAEIHLQGGGLDLYAVSDQADLYAAIDLVRDEMIHSLTQNKGKKETLTRRGGRMVKDVLKGLNFFKKRS